MDKDEVLAVLGRCCNVARMNAQAHPESRLLRSHAEDCEQARATIAAWNVSPSADVVPPAAQEVKQDGMSFGVVVAGDWAIPTYCGARIVDARMAYGWNQCREEMLERLSQLAQQGGESKDG